MHHASLALLPVLAAEKSKVPFYVAGGALALWAVIVSMGIGLRLPDFPGSAVGQRAVIGVTAVLVVAAMATAVLTSGVPAASGGVQGVSGSENATPAPPSAGAVGVAPQNAATASTLKLAADPGGQLKYDKATLKAPAGRVTIDFTNASPIPHNVTVEQQSGVTVGQTPIQTGNATLSLNLKPGSYVFYCAVPGHRQAGMQGTLIVS